MSKTIEITKAKTVNIGVSEYKGQNRLDIREYVHSNKYTGPTKKGVNLPVYKIDELIKYLQEIRAEIVEAGISLEEDGE